MPTALTRFPGRNPWPYGIVAAFVIFIGATAGLIVFTSFHGQELVTRDYYEQELRYQQRLDSRERTGSLRSEASVRYDAAADCIQLVLPPQHASPSPVGTIQLYRPAASGEDRNLPLTVDLVGRQRLDAQELSAGLWRVRVAWQHDGQDYSLEERLIVRPNASR
jgi:hypothetical protein